MTTVIKKLQYDNRVPVTYTSILAYIWPTNIYMDASIAWNWLNSDINLQYFQISTDEIEVRIMTKSQLCKINHS